MVHILTKDKRREQKTKILEIKLKYRKDYENQSNTYRLKNCL